jgi:hypothetical protein
MGVTQVPLPFPLRVTKLWVIVMNLNAICISCFNWSQVFGVYFMLSCYKSSKRGSERQEYVSRPEAMSYHDIACFKL